MDRSAFSFKGSTNDFEKRQEFKAKLASKIEPPQPTELPPTDTSFNGVSPGGILVHPSLGEGTLVEVDHGNNEVLIDFGSKGLIGLVLSQAKSFVHAPVSEITKGIAGKDDAFIGSEITTRTLAPQDRDFREVDFTKIISPDFAVTEKTFIPVGSKVWHPDLGVCLVLGIDEKTNYIALSSENTGIVEMVLSQVRSKLREVETDAEHIPMQPLVREKLAAMVPQYTSRSDVSVSIPEVFKTWQRSQQFMYLTRNQKLSTDQANDVFSVLDGGKPMVHSVTIAWQSQEEVEANIIPGPEALSTMINDVRTFGGFQEKRLWHPDFGECSVASVEGNQLILMTSVGQVPCVLDATVPKLAVLTASVIAPEHAPKKLGTTSRVLVTSDASVGERPIVKVSLPEAFVTWRTVDQYQFLTVSRHLIPEHANDIIATMTGKLHNSSTEYVIEWTDELPEANKRAEFKQQLQTKVEVASVEPVAITPEVIVVPGVKRWTEDVITKREAVKRKVDVDLPLDFNSWTSSGQYVFLTRTKQLTFTEANDILDILGGKSLYGNVEYNITWNGSPIAGTPNSQRVITEWVEETVMVESALKKIEVTLPAIFNNWASSGKFGYLTRTRQLTFDQANDVLAILDGKTPQNNKVKYEIVWSE